MGFEKFVAKNRRTHGPAVRVLASGQARITLAARAMIGDPQFVTLAWDADRRLIGILPAAESDPTAYKCHEQGMVSMCGIIHRIGVDRAIAAGVYPAMIEGEMLVFGPISREVSA